MIYFLLLRRFMSAWGQVGDVVEQAFESSHIRPPPNTLPPFRIPFFFPMFRSVLRLDQARGLTYACYSVLHFFFVLQLQLFLVLKVFAILIIFVCYNDIIFMRCICSFTPLFQHSSLFI